MGEHLGPLVQRDGGCLYQSHHGLSDCPLSLQPDDRHSGDYPGHHHRRVTRPRGANGVAILLPVTFVMPHTSGIILLSCIYWGALFGGAITSILFNIPGEPWSVATTFDGHPMAKRGLGGQALTAAFMSSFIGAAFAIILVTFLRRSLPSFRYTLVRRSSSAFSS